MELIWYPSHITPRDSIENLGLHQPRLDAWDKCSGLVHWEDPEESGGEGGGRGDRDGEYM